MSKNIVYYVVGPVHPRNLQSIARVMPNWTFRATYEMDNQWLNGETMSEIPFENVVLSEDLVPDSLWEDNVSAVIFSTTQPRQGPINLLRSAFNRNIPTIAIQESNQIALNAGTINNYILPVDHLLVASGHERIGMIDAGTPEHRIQVTGWPFFTSHSVTKEQKIRQTMKQNFNLDPERPTATLALSALSSDPGESPSVHRRQLQLAATGLPPEYQLVVKLHPSESLDMLMPFVTECAPHANVIEGTVPIGNVLQATDVLLSRGASQVSIEALLHDIPVIILDTGTQNPFKGLIQDLIVKESKDLAIALNKIYTVRNPMLLYNSFMEEHVPYAPQKALNMTCRSITEIATNSACELDRTSQWIDLAMYQAWGLDRSQAVDILSNVKQRTDNYPTKELKALIEFKATHRDLDELKVYIGKSFKSQILRCLWIDQLKHHRRRPSDSDIEWMQDFPSKLNTRWFSDHTAKWLDMLLRMGNTQAATDLINNLSSYHFMVSNFEDLARKTEIHQAGMIAQLVDYLHRKMRKTRTSLGSIKREVLKSI